MSRDAFNRPASALKTLRKQRSIEAARARAIADKPIDERAAIAICLWLHAGTESGCPCERAATTCQRLVSAARAAKRIYHPEES